MVKDSTSLPPLPLPTGVNSSYVDCTSSCGLTFHILSAGKSLTLKRPLILLTHGYPEIAFSWRNLLVKLAAKGYYVVAPDQRGYGRTVGWDTREWDRVDLRQFTYTNLVRDMVCLVYALGYDKVHSIIGHDFGAITSSMTALMRPDMFTSSIHMSHPHHTPPSPPFDVGEATGDPPAGRTGDSMQKAAIVDELAAIDPPRKHYKWYNSSPNAAEDWAFAPQGLRDFLRGYFHLKSADWSGNKPHPLCSWTATELAKMPNYYILPFDKSMPEAVADDMKGENVSASRRWLSDGDLAVYVFEWQRTGFQGGLNWYRAQTTSSSAQRRDMLLFAGRKIEVPTLFISGMKDWGSYQQPGALEKYEESCSDFRGRVFIEGAGHFVQQEQPEKVLEAVLGFLQSIEDGKKDDTKKDSSKDKETGKEIGKEKEKR